MTSYAIVGGGISGLSAAWQLSAEPGVEVTVFEADARLGGKIATERFGGVDIDLGADNVLRRTPAAVELCREVGLATDALIHPAQTRAKVWVENALRPLPAGTVLGFPVDLAAVEASGVLSAEGLRRAALEPTLPGLPIVGDVSLGELARARYGDEVTTRLIDPLLGGIAAGDLDRMSLDAVAPQIAEVAHTATSLIEGLAPILAAAQQAGPVFAAPPHGMEQLVTALTARLVDRGVRFETGAALDSLPSADGVVVATPALAAARLLRLVSPPVASALDAIEHTSVVFVVTEYAEGDVAVPLDGSGFLVPRQVGAPVTAVSWASSKWERLRQPGTVLLRSSLGHRDADDVIDASDDAIIAAVQTAHRRTMGIDTPPRRVRIVRYRDAFPQYDVGHLDRIAALDESLLRDAPHVALCGMAFGGVGIPACIRRARTEAGRLHRRVAG